MHSAECKSLGVINYFRQSVWQKLLFSSYEKSCVGGIRSLFINACIWGDWNWQIWLPIFQLFSQLPCRLWHSRVTTCLAMWGKLAHACPFVWALARLPHLGCNSSSCNVGKAPLPSRNIILLPDTQRECVKAETMLVFQGERKNNCHGHKYVVWTVTQEARGSLIK